MKLINLFQLNEKKCVLFFRGLNARMAAVAAIPNTSIKFKYYIITSL